MIAPLHDPAVGHVLEEVAVEVARQDVKWGEQNHPDVHPDLHVPNDEWPPSAVAFYHGISSAIAAKRATDGAAAEGQCSWAAIAVEELAEAVEAAAMGDTDGLRAELIQVAAVAVQWVQAIDRRTTGGAQ